MVGGFSGDGSSTGFYGSSRSSPRSHSSANYDSDKERFSRKVFVGGLPPDIDEGEQHISLSRCLSDLTVDIIIADEITASFRRFGPLVVDWPHKAESKSYFPPKGYAFLLFQVGKYSCLLIRDQRDQRLIPGRELCAAADRGVYPGRGQAVPLCQLTNNQRQAGSDQALEAERRRLCPGRHTTSRPKENGIRRWGASTSESR